MSKEYLITVQEAADRIGWPVIRLRAYCTAERIPCEMDPKTFGWMVKLSDCVQLLRKTEGQATCRL